MSSAVSSAGPALILRVLQSRSAMTARLEVPPLSERKPSMLLTAFQAHVKLLAGVVHGRNWAAFWGGSGRGRGVGKQRFFLRGDLDLASEASVREELLLVVDGSTDDVVIDCSALSF